MFYDVTNQMNLAKIIAQKLRDNFSEHHLSENLMRTITVDIMPNGDVKIDIPAKMYDIKEWTKKKVVIYTGEGSYAEAVSQSGGFSSTKSHKNYIDNAIKEGVIEWKSIYHIKG